eukprot:CAMPEP_0204474554 /NCGR_PEP_ID=MMETSP0471-20130131/26644_1 /ASSEMBLY_ACC=CAM_ASM_000602 /TAXON_ID=2969 /ORGANISM="Oxyrrhis marina" /LENGTH=58 /DNA_ID=CAMNT_0051476945 /DNA_START=270 /DNA_END=443 /DNA_ORIENTATION=-
MRRRGVCQAFAQVSGSASSRAVALVMQTSDGREESGLGSRVARVCNHALWAPGNGDVT